MPISLVTGGAGFIGSHVADHLLRLGHRNVVGIFMNQLLKGEPMSIFGGTQIRAFTHIDDIAPIIGIR